MASSFKLSTIQPFTFKRRIYPKSVVYNHGFTSTCDDPVECINKKVPEDYEYITASLPTTAINRFVVDFEPINDLSENVIVKSIIVNVNAKCQYPMVSDDHIKIFTNLDLNYTSPTDFCSDFEIYPTQKYGLYGKTIFGNYSIGDVNGLIVGICAHADSLHARFLSKTLRPISNNDVNFKPIQENKQNYENVSETTLLRETTENFNIPSLPFHYASGSFFEHSNNLYFYRLGIYSEYFGFNIGYFERCQGRLYILSGNDFLLHKTFNHMLEVYDIPTFEIRIHQQNWAVFVGKYDYAVGYNLVTDTRVSKFIEGCTTNRFYDDYTVFSYNNNLYIIGGYDTKLGWNKKTYKCYIHDQSSQYGFSYINEFPAPFEYMRCARVVMYNNEPYLFGGFYKFSPEGNEYANYSIYRLRQYSSAVSVKYIGIRLINFDVFVVGEYAYILNADDGNVYRYHFPTETITTFKTNIKHIKNRQKIRVCYHNGIVYIYSANPYQHVVKTDLNFENFTTYTSYDLYNFEQFTEDYDEIQDVTFNYVLLGKKMSATETNKHRALLKTYGNIHVGDFKQTAITNNDFKQYSVKYVVNPHTNNSWTASEINNMAFGLEIEMVTIDGCENITPLCQTYAVINYYKNNIIQSVYINNIYADIYYVVQTDSCRIPMPESIEFDSSRITNVLNFWSGNVEKYDVGTGNRTLMLTGYIWDNCLGDGKTAEEIIVNIKKIADYKQEILMTEMKYSNLNTTYFISRVAFKKICKVRNQYEYMITLERSDV